MRRKVSRSAQLLTLVLAVGATLTYAGTAPADPVVQHAANGFANVKPVNPVCEESVTTGHASNYWTRGQCVRMDFFVSNTPASNGSGDVVTVEAIGPDGAVVATETAVRRSTTAAVAGLPPTNDAWRANFNTAGWPAGKITFRVTANGEDAGAGIPVFINALAADVSATPKADGEKYEPGEAVTLQGSISELNDVAGATERSEARNAQFFLQARTPTGEVRGPYGPFTAGIDGTFSGVQLPGAATSGLTAGPETNFKLAVAVDVIDATSQNPVTGDWSNAHAGTGSIELVSRPTTLLLENRFVSSLGWVKPGQAYPFRVFVKNFTDEAQNNVTVTIPAPSGVVFTGATPVNGAGTATVAPTSLSWQIASIATDTTATLVVEARAKGPSEDERIVWKDLSTKATMTYDGGPSLTSSSRGPKVIPPTGGFETARYGDKPFPMIPVDFRDRKHKSHHSGDALAKVVNSPDYPGSTYNLYQEMSYGQLHPFGSVPSVGIASRNFEYEPGFDFTERDVRKPSCRGATLGQAEPLFGTPAYAERIHDGWYQLPGDTEYYGGDYPVFTATTIGIDSACGDTSRMIYDAVQIADPEIDYNQFDSDKDGVVDFTMVVFAGCGGNGSSQLHIQCEDNEVYDNPWPHSSSLENSWEDPVTKLTGYISDDQLTDLEGKPQCWKDATYSEFADCASAGGVGRDDLPTYVRVGPYNINPENAIDQASVIAHEYGHHLGLPDFYSSYSAYNDTNLMASDYSQHMTIFGKQDLGWVVPNFMQPGETRNVSDWEEIKNDTGQIHWRTPGGEPYTLSAGNGDQNIHNGEAYALKLPRKLIIDPAKVEAGASAPDVYWSGRGNDFGCAPKAGHNLDIVLPELENVPAGTPISLKFKSSWDIEWDFDYGFVLATTDGTNYTSLPSENGYTTPSAVNPNGSKCQEGFGNGITGTSGAYEAGTAQVAVDRAESYYDTGSPFIEDEYDLSQFAGKRNVVLRFSYATDPGLDRPGWFIDDVEIRAGDELIYGTDFSEEDELRIFSGGCGEGGRRVASKCTDGWNLVKSDEPSQLDHGYYLELRDRSGFDFASRGQADRGELAWDAGVFLEYTDEIRGYGNNGGSQPPRQHYLDSQPTPGADCGGTDFELEPEPQVLPPKRCEDVAFTAAAGDNGFRDQGWVDNFADDSSADGLWHFDYGCLTLNVGAMSGNTSNSEALPSDLTANATITAGSGCEPFEYWAGGVVNAAPTAVASADPKTAAAGQTVTFSAAGSFDDVDAPDKLSYDWAFGDGTTASGAKATHAYAAKGTYEATLTVTDSAGLTGTATVSVTVSGPDLQVSNVSASQNKAREGQKVTLTATVRNAGPGRAPASKTEFLLDGTTVLGLVDTPALADGQSAQVSVLWDTRNVKGEHTIRATADKPGAVAEENEGNNSGTRTVTVQGNKVTNGSFEQQTATGAPEAWSSQSTSAGTASSSSSGGTDGSNAAQMSGNGGNAATSGSPSWTSAPFSVQAGEVYDVTAAVKASGASSAASLGLVYLGAAGQVLDTVKVLTAPLQTDGFRTLERSVTIPPLVTEVRVVLTGFAPTDLATRGTVTFDDVGVFSTS
jgi:immune inhibitor A